MSLYDVTEHSLLSERARQTSDHEPEAFEALAVVAETALGLAGTSFVGNAQETARLAVVYTVNKMAALSGEEEVLESEQMGEGRSVKYRALVDPLASISRTLVRSLGVVPLDEVPPPPLPPSNAYQTVYTI